MGEKIGSALSGRLHYVGRNEFDRLRGLGASRNVQLSLFADACRLNTLYMIARAGSGHIGSSFSSMDMLAWLYLSRLKQDDVFFSSKGHDAPALYAVMIALGRLPFEAIDTLRRLGGLPGHPDVGVQGMTVNSGSLGMGISKAKGLARADRHAGRKREICVITGDGELQEGQIWESLISATNERFSEILVLVDHNKIQSDLKVVDTSDLGDLEAKFRAFGCQVARCDGHDFDALEAAVASLKEPGLPRVVIADTVKGKGVSFMEHTAMESDAELYRFHSGAPDDAKYHAAVEELTDRINGALAGLGVPALKLDSAEQSAPAPAGNLERLVPAYSHAIIEAARSNNNLFTLDADLLLDTGLIPFRKEFPGRFVECGIAEQDMVSQAGALALSGCLPVVHSFACFLTPRANEQIYNNATEQTKIVYVGTLAGLLPAGPGHSHQGIRDIAALSGIPGLTMVQPSCAAAVAPLTKWCIQDNPGSSYIRLTSIGVEIPFAFPPDFSPKPGWGVALKSGSDGAIVAHGPVLLAEAWHAAAEIAAGDGPELAVFDMPWLNVFDNIWLETLASAAMIAIVDDHYLSGGLSEKMASALAGIGYRGRIVRFGVEGIPACGAGAEVLRHHQLDRSSLAARLRAAYPG